MKFAQPLTIAALIALPWGAFAGETELYSLEKANSGKTGPWKGKDMAVQLSPGESGNLAFKLEKLPAHKFLKIEVELKMGGGGGFGTIFMGGLAGGMGGKASKEVQERLKITSGDKTLLHSSFSSGHLGQSFPDAYGSFSHEPGTGAEAPEKDAAGAGVIGLEMLGGNMNSGIYKFELLLPHDAEDLALDFGWVKEEAKGAEGMGMIIRMAGGMLGEDNGPYTITGLTVTALDESPTPTIDAEGAKKLLDAMASDKPLAAHAAMQKLIGAGDSVLPFIRERFAVVPDPDLAEKFKAAAEGLRADAFKDRAKAEADLIGMGVDALPHVITKLTEGDKEEMTPDFRMGLEKVKKKLQESAKASSDQALANRLHHALALSGSEEAKKTLAVLPPVKKLTPYVAPDKPKGLEGFEELEGGFELDFGE